MVEINKYGSVIDWPVDFFDQTDREIERILFEASLKRKKEKTNQKVSASRSKMNAVINFEYLVSPALSDDFYFDKVVDNLRILSELLSSGVYSIYLEKI